ncbi:hypothetical protein JOD43_001401 [Pullulanibacillus pueri]|nr:hypothetical protein [Pullulanibacillus pueri]
MSEDPLGKLDYHPKLAEATKDDRLKTSRPVTTPTLPTSCGHEESERSGAEIHTFLMTRILYILIF